MNLLSSPKRSTSRPPTRAPPTPPMHLSPKHIVRLPLNRVVPLSPKRSSPEAFVEKWELNTKELLDGKIKDNYIDINNSFITDFYQTIQKNPRVSTSISSIQKSCKTWFDNYNERPENKEITDLFISYKNECDSQPPKNNGEKYSYGDLTKYINENLKKASGVEKWKFLHNYREDIYMFVKKQIVEAGYDTTSFKDFGSIEPGSDIDITIFNDSSEIAFLLAYSFGVFNNLLFHNEPYSINKLIELYILEFQLIFDIVPYSSNGVIKLSKPLDMGTSLYRMLSMISYDPDDGTSLYQVIHKTVCRDQQYMFELISCLLLKDINNKIRHGNYDFTRYNDNMGTKFINESTKVLNQCSLFTKNYLKTLYDLSQSKDVTYKFKLQLWASHYAETCVSKITKDVHDMNPENKQAILKEFCLFASVWEFFQIVANLVSPESAWSVQNFVTTVIVEQRGYAIETDMQNDMVWIACVENIRNILHQKHEKSLRKQYKYTLRAQGLLYVLASEKRDFMLIDGLAFHLNSEEGNSLRIADAKRDVIIQKKVDKVLCFLLANIMDLFAPPRIKVLVNDSYIRKFTTK